MYLEITEGIVSVSNEAINVSLEIFEMDIPLDEDEEREREIRERGKKKKKKEILKHRIHKYRVSSLRDILNLLKLSEPSFRRR